MKFLNLLLLVLLGFTSSAQTLECAVLGDPLGEIPEAEFSQLTTIFPKNIKIVVHICYTDSIPNSMIPESAIQPAIDQLNVDFEGTEISFTLAGYDYTDLRDYAWHDAYVGGQLCFPDYQVQITELCDDILWDLNEYCNVYVIPKMCSTILGFAYVGFSPLNKDDGVWALSSTFGVGDLPHLNPDFAENETLTHEVGHYCGLHHVFRNVSNCGQNIGDCNSSGDYVCDTPPTKASVGCPGVEGYYCPMSNYNGVPFFPNNHMDYSKEACRDFFTEGQIQRMHEMLEYQRYELYDDDTAPPFCPGDFNQDGNIGTGDLLVILAYFGCIGCNYSQGDVTLDYVVGVQDLNWILAYYGDMCPLGPDFLSEAQQQKWISTEAFSILKSHHSVEAVKVYDLLGRRVQGFDFSSGVYIFEIIFTNGEKLVLKKGFFLE